VFSQKTVADSNISILEVLQWSTLQLHSSLASERQLALLGDLAKPNVHLPDSASPLSWFLSADVLPSDSLANRSSILGLYIILFERWSESKSGDDDGAPGAGGDNDGWKRDWVRVFGDDSSPASFLGLSGLTWLLRALDLVSRGYSSVLSRDELFEFASTGTPPSSAASAASPAPLFGTGVEMLKNVSKLWPVAAKPSDDAPNSAAKKAGKERQAKMMAAMQAKQKAFMSTIATEDMAVDDENEDECAICRCNNGQPLCAIAHVQRSRVLHHRNVASGDPEIGKLFRVVGKGGCQLRETSDVQR
jgi:hypothetical protein